jgi:hypothetical protein
MEPLDLDRLEAIVAGTPPQFDDVDLHSGYYVKIGEFRALLREARAAARMRKAATALLAYFDRCGAPAYEHMEALRASLGGEGGKE